MGRGGWAWGKWPWKRTPSNLFLSKKTTNFSQLNHQPVSETTKNKLPRDDFMNSCVCCTHVPQFEAQIMAPDLVVCRHPCLTSDSLFNVRELGCDRQRGKCLSQGWSVPLEEHPGFRNPWIKTSMEHALCHHFHTEGVPGEPDGLQ